MSIPDRDPSRWKTGPAAASDPAERWLGDALRDADAAARNERGHPAVASRSAVRRLPAALVRARGRSRRWSWALAGALVAVAAGTTFAGVYRAVLSTRSGARPASVKVDTAPTRARAGARGITTPTTATSDAAPPPAASVPAVMPPPPPLPAPSRRNQAADAHAVAVARPATKAARTPLAPPLDQPLWQNLAPARVPDAGRPATGEAPPTEARLLGRALWRLRAAADPAGALEALAEHDRAYGSGRLGLEAELIRVESWLQLGNAGAALVSLNALPVERIAQSRRLSLLRGELRASSGACAAALDDLERVLRDDATDAWAERAQYARAACHARLGNVTSAREELRRYLGLFPSGRHRRDALEYLAR